MPRNKKYWKQRFGPSDTSPYHDRFDLRRIPDLDDEGFAHILNGIRGINMLDLNETEITNASIALLTQLEYVNELGIKGCTDINDGCISDLSKLTSLQFLHAKDTGITIDGLLQLGPLTNLTKLLFSADDTEGIKDKMLQLRQLFPQCNFIVNSVPYNFENEE